MISKLNSSLLSHPRYEKIVPEKQRKFLHLFSYWSNADIRDSSWRNVIPDISPRLPELGEDLMTVNVDKAKKKQNLFVLLLTKSSLL